MSLAKLTAAPMELEYNKKIYRVSPLRDRDLGELQNFIQDKYLSLAKRNLDGMSTENKSLLLKTAFEKATTLRVYSAESSGILNSVEGIAKMSWLSLRKEHSDLTFDQVWDLCNDSNFVENMMQLITELNKVDENGVKKN